MNGRSAKNMEISNRGRKHETRKKGERPLKSQKYEGLSSLTGKKGKPKDGNLWKTSKKNSV